MAVASTRLLCELPQLQTPAAAAAWGQLLAALLKCLEQRGEQAEAAGEGFHIAPCWLHHLLMLAGLSGPQLCFGDSPAVVVRQDLS